MQLSFHGADRGVTGSCHLVECAGKKIMIDTRADDAPSCNNGIDPWVGTPIKRNSGLAPPRQAGEEDVACAGIAVASSIKVSQNLFNV